MRGTSLSCAAVANLRGLNAEEGPPALRGLFPGPSPCSSRAQGPTGGEMGRSWPKTVFSSICLWNDQARTEPCAKCCRDKVANEAKHTSLQCSLSLTLAIPLRSSRRDPCVGARGTDHKCQAQINQSRRQVSRYQDRWTVAREVLREWKAPTSRPCFNLTFGLVRAVPLARHDDLFGRTTATHPWEPCHRRVRGWCVLGPSV